MVAIDQKFQVEGVAPHQPFFFSEVSTDISSEAGVKFLVHMIYS